MDMVQGIPVVQVRNHFGVNIWKADWRATKIRSQTDFLSKIRCLLHVKEVRRLLAAV